VTTAWSFLWPTDGPRSGASPPGASLAHGWSIGVADLLVEPWTTG